MATTIVHRRIRIVTLEEGESIPERCRANDIAIVRDATGWWTYFIDENGDVSGYDEPFESYEKALWTAKAAAEFAAE